MIAARPIGATARTFVRFVLVGLINMAVGYALYLALLRVGLPAQAALLLSFVLGVLWNYLTTARYVFRVRGFGRLPAFAGCYVAVYLANAGALALAMRNGVPPAAAQAVLTPLAAALSFVLLSWAMADRGAGAASRHGCGGQ